MFIVDDQIHSIKNTAHNVSYKVHFITNFKSFNLLNLLSCIILTIFCNFSKIEV